ncbi:MAG: hypothetical protein ACYDH5_18085 [Acidimicrobiales bacterium]
MRKELLAADLGEVDHRAEKAHADSLAALRRALADIDVRQERLVRAIETHDDHDGRVFSRVRDRLGELEAARRARHDELAALQADQPGAAAKDADLLDELPFLDISLTSTQVEVVFLDALVSEGLLELAGTRATQALRAALASGKPEKLADLVAAGSAPRVRSSTEAAGIWAIRSGSSRRTSPVWPCTAASGSAASGSARSACATGSAACSTARSPAISAM